MSNWLPIDDIAKSVNSGKITAAELVEKALGLIDETKEYNAVIGLVTDRARARAKDIDARIAAGESAGRLAGVPFITKDNFLVFGGETTAASTMLGGFTAPYQATAIELLEAEGAICVGKANLDAFAHGGSTENSDYGVTLNAVDKTRVPGGSSGGSATVVALDVVAFALGSDTGGSCREPASFSGCVGYKPTYGLISRYGVVAMASSTDVVGLLTRNSSETAYLLDILAGKDAKDSTTVERQKSYTIDNTPSQPKAYSGKVGVVKEFMGEGVDPSVRSAIENSVAELKSSGVEIVEVSIPSIDLALACYYIIVPAEISSNLSRYDGQRYGFSDDSAADLEQSFSGSRGSGFNAENKRRIMLGTYVLSSGYYDAYYKQAAKLRTILINEFNEAFKKVDFLIGPTAPTTAPAIGQNAHDPLSMYLLDIMTVPVNLVGVPAISIPANVGDKMPIGLQIIGTIGGDKELLQFSNYCEGVIGSTK
jgi:aspartyl-tRNA(Asn)/glutamyl-tRNA(Gln) amidotransferase subunit A